MRSKRYIRKALWTAAALGLVAGVLLALVHLPWVRQAAWQRIRSDVETDYGVRLSGSGFRYNLLRFSFEIDDLTLALDEEVSAPALTADRVAIDVALWRSLLDMPTIEDARIEGARIVIDTGGRNANAPFTGPVEAPASATGLPLPVRIEALQVQGETLTLGDATSPLGVTAEDWRLEASGNGPGLRLTLDVARARIENPYVDLELATMASTVEIADGGLRIESFEAASPFGSLSLAGTLGDPGDPVLDLEATIWTPLEALLPGLAEGVLSTRAEIRERLPDLTVTARSRGEGLRAGPLADLTIDAPWSWTRGENRLSVTGLTLESPLGGAGLTGEVSLDGNGPSRASVEVRNLELSRVADLIASPIRPAGRATGTFDGSWESLEWQGMSGSGRLELTSDGARVGPGTIPLAGALDLGVRGGGFHFQTDGLGAGPLTLQADLELDPSGPIVGEIGARTRDVAGTIDAVMAFVGNTVEPRSLPYPEGPLEATVRLAGAWNDPEAGFRLRAPRLRYDRFVDVSLSGEGSYSSGRLDLASVRVASGEEQLRARGRLDLATSPLTLDLEVSGVGISPRTVLTGLGREELGARIAGRFDVESRVQGALTDPRVSGRVDGSGVSAYGIEIGGVGGAVEWDGESLEATDLVLMGSLGDASGMANGALSYRPASGRYALRMEGSGFSLESLTLGRLEASGHADFLLEGEGALDEPRGRLDLRVARGAYGPVDLGAIALAGTVAEGTLQVSLGLPGHGLAADSTIALDRDWATSVRLTIEDLDLASIEPLVPERLRPVSGRIRGSVEASGHIPRWRDGTFRVEFAETEARIGEAEFATVGQTILGYADGRFSLEPAVFLAGGQRLRASGDLPLGAGDRPGVVRVEGALDVGTLVPTLVPDASLAADGVASVDLQLRGSLARITPTLRAALREGSLAFPWMPDPLTGVEADLAVSAGTLDIERVGADWGSARIDASGTAPLGLLSKSLAEPVPGALAHLEARLSSVDLAAIPGMPTQVTGRAEGRLSLEAGALSLDALEASLLLDTLETSIGGIGFEQEEPTTASLSNGRVELEPFRIRGPSTSLTGSGTFGLRPSDPLRLDLTGRTDTLVFSSGTGGAETSGNVAIDLRLRGTLEDPAPSGELELSDVMLNMQSPIVVLNDLDARLLLDPETIVLQSATGTLNGGTIDVRGSVGHRGGAITEGTIEVRVADVFAEVPEGLTTLSDVDLSIVSTEDDVIQVGGNVRILEGAYTRDIELGALLLEYVGSGPAGDLLTEPDPTLSRIRYEVSIDTLEPLVIDNNIASAEAAVNLQLVGSYYRPGLVGRIVLDEGGEITIRDTRYVLDAGTVEFISPNRIEPSVNIAAQTEYKGYDVTIRLNGGGENLETTLTSDPPLSEPDIVSLLVTGRTLDEVRGEGLDVAREQALYYVTGAVGNRLSREAEQTLGLSRVRIEPDLIANESNPGARLTIGQDLTRDLELIYSMNLTDSKDQIWVGEYSVTPRLLTRGVIQEDNTYRLEARHDLTFGGPDRSRIVGTAAVAGRRLESVRISPASFDGRDLASVFDVGAGRRYNFFEIRQGSERLNDFFDRRDYLESRVRLDREIDLGRLDLNVAVDPGPRVQLDFQGTELPRQAVEAARRAWRESSFDALRGRRAVGELRNVLVSEGYLEASAGFQVALSGNLKTVRFDVDPGPRYRRIDIAFEGVNAFEEDRLRNELRSAGAWERIHTEPDRARELLELRYRNAGYRDARVDPLRYEFRPAEGRARLTIPVREGPEYRISGVRFEGNTRFSGVALSESAALEAVTASLDRLNEAERAIEERYWGLGYNDIVIERALTPAGPGAIDVTFSIRENRQGWVEEIEIAGTRTTSERFVERQFTFQTGQPLNFDDLNDTRRKLYDTRAYSLVEFQTSRIDAAGGDGPDITEPVRVRLNLEEVPRYKLRYGGYYDTDRGPGVIADFRRQNLWGGARVLGLSGRYDGEQSELRTFYSQPSVVGLPLDTNLSLFVSEEVEADVQTTRRHGFEIGQQVDFANAFLLSYGFRYEKTRTIRTDPSLPTGEERLSLAPLSVSLSRDTRDNLLDASSGWFTSHAVEYATPRLGSQSAFLRYFGQAFRYFPLSEPRPVPLSGGRGLKPRLVYAVGGRIGLIAGFEGGSIVDPGGGASLVPLSEKFFSGGGTTVRGFRQDTLGPLDINGNPEGGDAVITINNEIRFPVFSILEGVGFMDAGNVYRRIDAIDLGDLRASGGFGLRLRTPYFLLRADYGLKLDRRDGESAGALFFSIGQAF